MKHTFIALTAAIIFASCGNNANETKTEEKVEPKQEVSTSPSDNPDYQKGLALIGANDCLTCHKVSEKLIGPSYKDVAAKYANMSDTIITHLGKKIIHGGSGVWGEVPMAAHPAISEADAEAMVKYVLLLK